MNEQQQSPFFRLPYELRLLIYRQYLFNGGQMQHIEIDFYTERIIRRACNMESDEDVLRREIASLAKPSVTLKRWQASTYQNGHLGCLTSPILDAGYDPGPLLRTCRRIQAEASPEFYSLHVHDSRDLTAMLGPSYLGGAAERIVSLVCPCSFGMPDWQFDEFKQKLVLMKNLKRLKLVIDGGTPALRDAKLGATRHAHDGRGKEILVQEFGPKTLPPHFAGLFLEMGCGTTCEKIELEFRNLTPDQDDVTMYHAENRSLIVRTLRNAPWIYGLQDVLKDGIKGLDRVQERYTEQQMDLGQTRNAVSCV